MIADPQQRGPVLPRESQILPGHLQAIDCHRDAHVEPAGEGVRGGGELVEQVSWGRGGRTSERTATERERKRLLQRVNRESTEYWNVLVFARGLVVLTICVCKPRAEWEGGDGERSSESQHGGASEDTNQ